VTVAPAPERRWPRAAAALVVAAAATAGMLWYGGSVREEPLPGLPDPGGPVAWLLAATRLGTEIAAVVTIGLLVAAVVLSPRDAERLSRTGLRRLRAAGWAATAWLALSLCLFCFTLADLLGVPLPAALTYDDLSEFATTGLLGRSLVLSAALTVVVALLCLLALTARGAGTALVVAVVAVVPPLFAGHAATGNNHRLGASALLLHVIPVAVWSGALLALLLTGRAATPQLTVAVRRFSPIAAGCLAAVAASGLLSAYARLYQPSDLTGTRYGQLILVKAGALLALGAVGLAQRRTALPALDAGDRRPFVRVATVEILLFAAAIGTAVALSRTAPPPFGGIPDNEFLGFPEPPPVSAGNLAGLWLLEPLFLAFAVVAAALYLAGVRRLRRRGQAWPVARTAAFLAGCALVVVASSSGLARFAPLLFSAFVAQQLLLGAFAPILLAAGGPVRLALAALPAADDPSAWPGPREWLERTLRGRTVGGRTVRVLTHPLAAAGLYLAGLYGTYMFGLYELTLRSHAAHLVAGAALLAIGYLFYSVVLGAPPVPRPAPRSYRLLTVSVTAALQAFLGLALMTSTVVVAEHWFIDLNRDWGPDPLSDQHLGGLLLATVGLLPPVVALLALRLSANAQPSVTGATDDVDSGSRSHVTRSIDNLRVPEK
jgi:putative copper resistance protein D